VLDAAIRSVLDQFSWDAEGFALAAGCDEQSGQYEGLSLPPDGTFGQILDTTLLVLPEVARRQQTADEQAAEQRAREAVPPRRHPQQRPAVD
jgi:hypothetical protein